jgi:hypothetical protein
LSFEAEGARNGGQLGSPSGAHRPRTRARPTPISPRDWSASDSLAEESLGRLDLAAEVAGDTDQRLRWGDHPDHRPDHGIALDQLHHILIVIDPVGGRIAGAEQKVSVAEHGQMADPLHVVRLQPGEDVGHESAEQQHRQRPRGHGRAGHR